MGLSLPQLEGLHLSYPQVGATAGQPPSEYRHVGRSVEIPPESFQPVGDYIRSWTMHRDAGVHVDASMPHAAVGVNVLLKIRLLGLTFECPVPRRHSWDDDKTSGFAYGTLEGHPESGEEAFRVIRYHDATRFEITGFSRPASTTARLSTRLTERFQDKFLDAYAAAVSSAALHSLRAD